MADVVINLRARTFGVDELTQLQTEIGMLKAAFDASRKEIDASKVGLIAYNTATREGSTALHNFNEYLLQSNGYWRDKNGRLRNAEGRYAAVKKTVEQLRREFSDNTTPAFFALTAAITDTDAELEALKTTAESAETIFEDSTGLVREWNEEWANSKVAVLDLKEALEGVSLPTEDVAPPTIEIPGLTSPLDTIIEDMNAAKGAADDLRQEVTDAGQSFDDLRVSVTAAEPSLDDLETKFSSIEASVDGLPEGISDFQASLELLSENAPNLLSGLFSVLSDVDDRFSGIAQTAGSIAKGDPVGFLSSIPGLQQSVQSLLAPLDESDASVQQRVALSVRRDIASSDLRQNDKQNLLADIDNFIREVTIRYIRSLPEAFANATVAQQESSLGLQGFDFDYDRDLAALQRLGIDFQQFGELFTGSASIDLSGVIATLGRLQELAESGRAGGSSPKKTRRDLVEVPVSFEDNEPVAAAPSAPGVVQRAESVPLVSELQRLITIETGIAENIGLLLAEETQNNAWKSAILELAAGGISVNVTFGGGSVVAGDARQAGEDLALVGGGQELFHDPQNDLLAFRAGQQAARGTSRAFSPNPTQRQNAADFSHYFGEGFAREQDQARDISDVKSALVEAFGEALERAQANARPETPVPQVFMLQFPSGAIREIETELIEGQDAGTLLGFGDS